MAAQYGAFIDKEVTTFNFQVHVDHLESFYPVFRDLILTPSFSEDDFIRLMLNQQNYVDQTIRASSDEDYSKKALEDLLFRGTPYQHMKQGMSESVKSITVEDIKKHYKKYFTRNNLMIGIAGNYSNDFLKMLKSDMQNLSSEDPALPKTVKANVPDGIQMEIIQKMLYKKE